MKYAALPIGNIKTVLTGVRAIIEVDKSVRTFDYVTVTLM